jgi:hypothetical protein
MSFKLKQFILFLGSNFISVKPNRFVWDISKRLKAPTNSQKIIGSQSTPSSASPRWNFSSMWSSSSLNYWSVGPPIWRCQLSASSSGRAKIFRSFKSDEKIFKIDEQTFKAQDHGSDFWLQFSNSLSICISSIFNNM